MYCTHCKKNHAGYRCPYCGNFELDGAELHNRHAKSIYAQKRNKADRSNTISSFLWLFLILFLFAAMIIGSQIQNSL